MTRLGWVLVALFLLGAGAFALMLRPGGGDLEGDYSASEPRFAPAPRSASAGAGALVIPVSGVRPDQLVDSFGDARTTGGAHIHGAIDIPAALGTPVVAVAPGTIEKIYEDARGGHTLYQRSDDGGTIYYYAHLDRYAPGLVEGQHLPQGRLVGAIGATGDAGAAGPHLHFEVRRMAAGERWWQGRAVDPYPLLGGR